MKYFGTESLAFFRGLSRNNRKPWFESHRDDYERNVKQPLADLVQEMDLRFAKIAPEMVGDPRRSVFRIHRDIRFSKDKSPYKTNAGCWFFHRAASSKVGQEAHGGGAGFYFHLEPGKSLLAGGCWMPPRPALNRFRAAIAGDRRAFERVVLAKPIERLGGLDRDHVLKRAPRGYCDDDPAAEWLKLESFTVSRGLTDAQVTSGRLTTLLADEYAGMLPFVRWLNHQLGLEPAKKR
jgi:uncharacterized protein (TIGR02453 family)